MVPPLSAERCQEGGGKKRSKSEVHFEDNEVDVITEEGNARLPRNQKIHDHNHGTTSGNNNIIPHHKHMDLEGPGKKMTLKKPLEVNYLIK